MSTSRIICLILVIILIAIIIRLITNEQENYNFDISENVCSMCKDLKQNTYENCLRNKSDESLCLKHTNEIVEKKELCKMYNCNL